MTDGPNDFVILVGGMKCGTDSIFQYVTQHPEVSGSDPWEPDFFADTEKRDQGVAWYRSLWDWDPERHAYAMEKSTAYTKRPRFDGVVERMEQFAKTEGATFRFLYAVRDPLDRIESHATHEASAPWGHPDPFSVEGLRGNWWTTSMYAKQIEPYARRFGRENIRFLNFEDLKQDPEGMTRSVWRFLGLPDDHPIEPVDPSGQSSVHEKEKHWALTLAEAIGLDALGDVLPDEARERVNEALRTPVGEKVRLSDTQRAFARHGLLEDLRTLRDRYDVDIDRWGVEVPEA